MNATMLTFLAPSAEPTSPSIPGRFSTKAVSCFALGIGPSLRAQNELDGGFAETTEIACLISALLHLGQTRCCSRASVLLRILKTCAHLPYWNSWTRMALSLPLPSIGNNNAYSIVRVREACRRASTPVEGAQRSSACWPRWGLRRPRRFSGCRGANQQVRPRSKRPTSGASIPRGALGFTRRSLLSASYKHYAPIASDQTSSSRAFIWMRADDRDRRTNS